MSHFTVLVIGDDFQKQLQPFHEFESTGTDDEFVQDLDVTAERWEEYERSSSRLYRDPEGNLHSPYKDCFYRDPTPDELLIIGPMFGSGVGRGISWTSKDWGDGQGYRAKVRFLPDGWEEVDVPEKEILRFADWLRRDGIETCTDADLDTSEEHKYGYAIVDARGEVLKVVDRTNPNKKWDWWKLGGRWTGFFKLKPGRTGEVGSPGLMTDPAKPGYADQAVKAAIDFEGMRREHVEEALERYRRFHDIAGGQPVPVWEEVRARHGDDIDAARAEFNGNPVIRALNAGGFFSRLDEYLVSPEVFAERAAASAISTFAVIKDGQWFERGEMGWWGAVRDEKERDAWNAEFAKLLDGLPDDTLLTLVDCHI